MQIKSRTLMLLLFTACFMSCVSQTKTDLSAKEFENAISNNDSIQLLDVRTPAEYNSGHIAKALLADWHDKKEFDRRIGFIDKNKPLYVYCLSGGRSAAAAEKLRGMGYEQVYELIGGINEWKAAGKTLEGRKTVKQMSLEDFKKKISDSNIVLVDFGAEWCPPCKKMEPVLKNLQENNAGKFVLVKVDGGNDEKIIQEYKVTALPVFIIFKDGKQIWRKDGIATEEIASQL